MRRTTALVSTLLVVTMALVIGLQSLLLWRILSDAQTAEQRYVQNHVNTLRTRLSKDLSELGRISLQIEQSKSLMLFLHSDTVAKRYELYPQVADLFRIMLKYNSLITSVHIITTLNDYYSFPESLRFEQWQYIRQEITEHGLETTPFTLRLHNASVDSDPSLITFSAPLHNRARTQVIALVVFEGTLANYRESMEDPYLALRISDNSGRTFPAGEIHPKAIMYTLPYGTHMYAFQHTPVIEASLRQYTNALLITLGVTVSMLMITAWLMRRRVTWPMILFMRQLNEIGNGKRRYIEIEHCVEELSVLAHHVNGLIDDLGRNREEAIAMQRHAYVMELERRTLHYYALQSQINPHFLYNTLQCIRGIALYHNVNSIADIATNMAEIFRYILKEEIDAPLYRELEIAQKMMLILNYRYGNSFSYETQVDPELSELLIPRLTIQPLVENAVKHGLLRTDRDGHVFVRCVKMADRILIEVEDNGIGFEESMLEQIRKQMDTRLGESHNGAAVGLRNLAQRIRARYGDEWGVTIVSKPGRTMVTVALPNAACNQSGSEKLTEEREWFGVWNSGN